MLTGRGSLTAASEIILPSKASFSVRNCSRQDTRESTRVWSLITCSKEARPEEVCYKEVAKTFQLAQISGVLEEGDRRRLNQETNCLCQDRFSFIAQYIPPSGNNGEFL